MDPIQITVLHFRTLAASVLTIYASLHFWHNSLFVAAVYEPARTYHQNLDIYNKPERSSLDTLEPSTDQYALAQYGYNADAYRKQERNVPPNNYQNQYNKQQLQQQQQQQRNRNFNNYQQGGGAHHVDHQYQQKSHKCERWIPDEAFQKFPMARTRNVNEAKHERSIEICCPGYAGMLWRGSVICRPVCKNCRNGLCIAPDQCKCYDEFVRNDNGDCVFTCPLGCLNGRCYLDGTCQCDAGYKLDETRKFCRPICSGGCGLSPRHNCTAPEVCGCAKGYQLSDGGCQPVCEPDCGLGGKCFENNICKCEAPYVLRNGVCQADCYQKCEDGICYARNRCICNPGFTYHERSTTCIPI